MTPETRPEIESGPALAAALSVLAGVLAFSAAFLAAELNPGVKAAMQTLGSWMPRAGEIGPLSGKFTLLLLVWLGSWAVLRGALGSRRPDLQAWSYILLVGLLAALLLLWPPLVLERLHG